MKKQLHLEKTSGNLYHARPMPSRPAPPADVLIVIPCLNEEGALGQVLDELPWQTEELRVVVVDNGSTDGSAEVAVGHGVEVVHEPRRGYGSACLRGLSERHGERFIVFLDADHSDYPEELPLLLEPLRAGKADLVIGSRMQLEASRRALLPQARWGNRLAAWILRTCYGQAATDLGPFRAITAEALDRLGMRDPTFGWTVEMQARAARLSLRTVEVPVRYRNRIGTSKISGTVSGTLRASAKILWTLAKLRLARIDQPADSRSARPSGS